MVLYEKIEMEPVEPEVPEGEGDLHRSSRRWSDETLTVVYPLWKRGLILLISLLLLPVVQSILEEGIFAFEVLTVIVVVVTVWYLGACLVTNVITFTPEGIVRTGLLGRTVLPNDSLVMTVSDLGIRFVYGSGKNIREAVTVHRFVISTGESEDVLAYVEDVYNTRSKWKRPAPPKTPRTSPLSLGEYGKSVDTYRTMGAFFIAVALIGVFAVGLSNTFSGFGHSLPSFPVRLGCIGLAVGAFLVLRRLAPTSARLEAMKPEPVTVRLERLDSAAFKSALVATAVAFIGLVLLFLFGNMFDFYLFPLVGFLYYHDCYPRLTTWEGVVRGAPGEGGERASLLPRRSLQVSVVLMGTLAMLSYGESSHYLYNSRKDCLDDWGDSRDCREATGGSGYMGSGRYYGPRYGSGGGRAMRSVGVGMISRGGFGSLGSFHASFGG